jgi:hypothetical protein
MKALGEVPCAVAGSHRTFLICFESYIQISYAEQTANLPLATN